MTGPYRVPPPGGHYRRRVGVVIEIEPNMFVQYILEVELPRDAIRVDVDYDHDPDVLSFGALGPVRDAGRYRARIEVSGRIIGKEEAERPVWADASAAEPAAEIEASSRPLPVGGEEPWTS